jgi:hypothetical protein
VGEFQEQLGHGHAAARAVLLQSGQQNPHLVANQRRPRHWERHLHLRLGHPCKRVHLATDLDVAQGVHELDRRALHPRPGRPEPPTIPNVDFVYFDATLGNLYFPSLPADTVILSGNHTMSNIRMIPT